MTELPPLPTSHATLGESPESLRDGVSARVRVQRSSWGLLLFALMALLGTSCTSVEDSRIRQYLVQKGFGTRADGEATAENYVAGGDRVQFILSNPTLVRQPGLEQLFLLTQAQPVDIDGTIYVPYIGRLPVLGMKETTLSATVSEALNSVLANPVALNARIISSGKVFYAFGEIQTGARRFPLLQADLTILDVISRLPITPLANLGRVKVVKPDATNPLIIVVNIRDIIERGYSNYNIQVEENDIIYIPPTFFGHIARFFEKLTQPIGAVVRGALGVATTRTAIDVLTNADQGIILGGGFGGRNAGRGF
ncbi:MAG: polysaccharide biosynthesis/export family protein [Planctomycetota bacterium]